MAAHRAIFDRAGLFCAASVVNEYVVGDSEFVPGADLLWGLDLKDHPFLGNGVVEGKACGPEGYLTLYCPFAAVAHIAVNGGAHVGHLYPYLMGPARMELNKQ